MNLSRSTEAIRYYRNTRRVGELVLVPASLYDGLYFLLIKKEIYGAKNSLLIFSVLLLSFTNNRSSSEGNI